jgi:CIC family chloride channel protein
MPVIEKSQAEVLEYLESQVVRRRLFPRAILVGVVSGTVAAGFRLALQGSEILRLRLLAHVPNSPILLAASAGIIAFIGTWVALIIGNKDKDSGGSGIPHMKAVLEGHSDMNWGRLICVKFAAALVAIGSGLALGREGPTVQMGGAAGIAVAESTGSTGRERRALAAAGAGAGLAAAFNAPLAGVTFVLEELQRDFQPVVFGAALLSAAIATVISRLASGQLPAFVVPHITTPSLTFIPVFILIGVMSGLLGILFNKGLLSSSEKLTKIRNKGLFFVSALAGLAVGGAFLVSPSTLGGGHGLTEMALHGSLALLPAIAYLIVRLLLVHISYGTGVPGGIFAPLLSLGALLGVVIFHGSNLFFAGGPGVAACAVAGMCGLFSGVVRAPLTGIILIAEMTGSYDMLLPLLASAFTAYAVAEGLGDLPIYEALLQRDAVKKGWDMQENKLVTAEFEVKGGSDFDGKQIKDLGLPQGVLVVLCREGGQEYIPRADTVLNGHTRIVVATSSKAGLGAVAEGVK